MKIKKIKLSALKLPERNIRMHTEAQLKEYVRSVKMFGQLRPIVADENDVIMAGVGLYQALELSGIKEADVLIYDGLTDNQKKKLMIADNKIFNLGIDNLETLNAFLEELHDDLDVPGFDEEILRTMVADAEEVTLKISEYGTLDDEEIEKIKQNAGKQDEAAPSESEEADDSEVIPGEPTQDAAPEYVICPKCGEQFPLSDSGEV